MQPAPVRLPYPAGLAASPGVPHYVPPPTGPPTYLPTHSEPATISHPHHQYMPSPLLPNVVPVGPQSCSSTNSGTVASGLTHHKRKRYKFLLLKRNDLNPYSGGPSESILFLIVWGDTSMLYYWLEIHCHLEGRYAKGSFWVKGVWKFHVS